LEILGTIVSEFPGYSFESAARLDDLTITIIYKEAKRQRTAKAVTLAALINQPNQDKSRQEDINDSVHKLLNPYEDQLRPERFDDNWDRLRR